MLIGCQTMINCFVFKRRRHANLLAICGQEFLLFVILVIWKQLIYYFLYKTPNKKHVCMYVCMLCYAMLCHIYPYFKHKLCPHYYASKTLPLWPFRQTCTQLCDNNLLSIPYNLQFLKPYHNPKFFTSILRPVMNCFIFER